MSEDIRPIKIDEIDIITYKNSLLEPRKVKVQATFVVPPEHDVAGFIGDICTTLRYSIESMNSGNPGNDEIPEPDDYGNLDIT